MQKVDRVREMMNADRKQERRKVCESILTLSRTNTGTDILCHFPYRLHRLFLWVQELQGAGYLLFYSFISVTKRLQSLEYGNRINKLYMHTGLINQCFQRERNKRAKIRLSQLTPSCLCRIALTYTSNSEHQVHLTHSIYTNE
jgi:hypothetical protein